MPGLISKRTWKVFNILYFISKQLIYYQFSNCVFVSSMSYDALTFSTPFCSKEKLFEEKNILDNFRKLFLTWSMTPSISSRKKKHSFSMLGAPLTLTSMMSDISPPMTSRFASRSPSRFASSLTSRFREIRLSTLVRQYFEPPLHWKRSQSVSHLRPKYLLVNQENKIFKNSILFEKPSLINLIQ